MNNVSVNFACMHMPCLLEDDRPCIHIDALRKLVMATSSADVAITSLNTPLEAGPLSQVLMTATRAAFPDILSELLHSQQAPCELREVYIGKSANAT